MFLCICLGCTNDNPGGDVPANELAAPTRFETHPVRACAVIDDSSPTFPSRLVFLHRTDRDNVDAQAELFAFDASTFRCGQVALYLVPGRDRTPVHMDFMSPASPTVIRELRVYRLDVPWDPANPFALAAPDDTPFSDYLFRADTVLFHPDDPAAIYLGTP